MALDPMVEEMIRTQANEQVAMLQGMGASISTVTEGLAVALEVFADAYKTIPQDVLEAVELAVEERAMDRKFAAEKAAERAAAAKKIPKITDMLAGILRK